ncbi:helix-turn-helix transcriptional regulator, partial [Pseudomonas otitidis]|nr:helix-turn-helix transcriptional regulator [Pseudomonas otitidis]
MPRTAPRPDRPGVPRLPPAHVPRPRLVAPLLEQPARLRLLCAPAGFGKSVLLSELLRAGADTHDAIAWIGLGGEALPVERLVAQVAAALQRPAP